MKIDITLNVTPEMAANAQGNDKWASLGHLGTHFDVMNKEFPLVFTERKGIVFDVKKASGREISCADVELTKVEPEMFVLFHTGFVDEAGYGSKRYVNEHPQLADELLSCLIAKQVSMIGIDFAGVRRGKEHSYWDQACADHGVFIVENMYNLQEVVAHGGKCMVHTYPLRFAEMTGLPCRVIADVE